MINGKQDLPQNSAWSIGWAMNEMLKDWIKQIKIFLLDMDGTIYIGDKPIGGMCDTLAAIRASGRKVVYCTNNSSRTADESNSSAICSQLFPSALYKLHFIR